MAHIVDKKCPAKICKNLMEYKIDPELCRGCSACSRQCPVNAIKGEIKSPFVIDPDACIKCGTCLDVCRFGAVYKD